MLKTHEDDVAFLPLAQFHAVDAKLCGVSPAEKLVHPRRHAKALVRRQRAAIGVGPHLHMESSLVAVHIPCDLVPHVRLDARLGEDLFHVWAEGGAEILAVQRKGGGGELGGVGEGLILPERGPWE